MKQSTFSQSRFNLFNLSTHLIIDLYYFQKLLLFSSIGCSAYLYIRWCYGLYKTSQEKVTNKPRVYGELSVGGPFELVDTKGTMVSSETLLGNWVLLYFGFTYCPDICPEQMELMGDVVDIAKKEHDIDVTPLMITIDLERDTPEVLEEYVNEYNPKIIGLLGTDQQIDDVCNAYRCYRSKGQSYDDPNDYILDHTVTQYLLNPDGKCVGYFMSNRGLEDRVKILLDHVENYNAADIASKASGSIFTTIKRMITVNTLS